jgi:hypothetical protein
LFGGDSKQYLPTTPVHPSTANYQSEEFNIPGYGKARGNIMTDYALAGPRMVGQALTPFTAPVALASDIAQGNLRPDEEARRLFGTRRPGEVGPTHYDRIREARALANDPQYAGEQARQVAAFRARSRQNNPMMPEGVKQKKTITDNTDGSRDATTEYVDGQGNAVKYTRKTSAYEQQYVDRLRQARDEQNQGVDISALASLTDELFGTQVSPHIQQARQNRMQDQANRLRASKALYDVGMQQEQIELQRDFKERQLALKEREALAKSKGKDDKPIDFRAYSYKFKERDPITNADLVKTATKNKGQMDRILKLSGIPKHQWTAMKMLSNRQSTESINDILAEMENAEALYFRDEKNIPQLEIRDNFDIVRGGVDRYLQLLMNYGQKQSKLRGT